MRNLSKEYKKIIENLDKNVKDKQELEFIKDKIYDVTALFLDELDKLITITESKLKEIETNQEKMEEKVTKIEKSVKEIERDIYMEEDEDFDLEIICPYCNKEFNIEVTETNQDIKCPECGNLIELDWNDDCSCGEDCNCDGECNSGNCKKN